MNVQTITISSHARQRAIERGIDVDLAKVMLRKAKEIYKVNNSYDDRLFYQYENIIYIVRFKKEDVAEIISLYRA